jgi:tRNA pseudouridine55 synthase
VSDPGRSPLGGDEEVPDGFLLVDKESGWTSHDVVARVRTLARRRKIGHAGTLDPMATGLLALGLGRATRLLRFLQELPKRYEARVVFGVATDTLDAEGAILSREPMPITEDELEGVLDRFMGTIMQVPPMVSALRVDGRRLYAVAREGEEVERAPRPVWVHELRLVDFSPGDYPEATLQVVCGKGTYVRSLADDIAQALGGRAHVSALRRTRIGSLMVSEAATVGELAAAAGERRLSRLVLTPAAGLRDLPAAQVPPDTAESVSHGMQIPAPRGWEAGADEPFRVVDGRGRLLAVYRRSGRRAVPEVVLA